MPEPMTAFCSELGHREAHRVAELRGTGVLVSLGSGVVVVVLHELPTLAPRTPDQLLGEPHPVDVRPRQVRGPAFAKRLGCVKQDDAPAAHDPQVDGA